MLLYYLSFGIAVLSSVLYHVFQRTISPSVNPVLSVLVTYLTAFLLTLPLFGLYPLRAGVSEELGRMNWASFALALAIVGLEIGFLLAYRAGWNVSVAGIAANAAAALLLLPTGVLFFHEKPTPVSFVGVLLCIVGLVLVSVRN